VIEGAAAFDLGGVDGEHHPGGAQDDHAGATGVAEAAGDGFAEFLAQAVGVLRLERVVFVDRR